MEQMSEIRADSQWGTGMKITICGSMTFLKEILEVERTLRERGYDVLIPERGEGFDYHRATMEERTARKRQHDLIRRHWEKIRQSDAILVLNYDKDGIAHYIGGNSFLEMGFAHVLSKPIYLLYPVPDMPYKSEMDAMDPIVLDGDLRRLPTARSEAVV
jgi:nucleoside 2-deoxyribosyltransferase